MSDISRLSNGEKARLIEYNKTLLEYFGWESLKYEQFKIIDMLINEKVDMLGLLPTGFGKSLCFQLPYLLTKKNVIVISPLISLMTDQKILMEKAGIPVCCLNSDNRKKGQDKQEIIDGSSKIIYITPEYLVQCEDFVKELIEYNDISLFCIDESHCVSSWGHEFRKSYQQLYVIREWTDCYELVEPIPILCLSATTTKRVQQDIITSLKMINPVIISGNFDRANLYISITKKSRDPLHDIRGLLEKYKDNNIIVYCQTRKDTESLAEKINNSGLVCEAYHAGLNSTKRDLIQHKFTNGAIKCIVATIAFGMGINISNIRLVIHYACPKNIESYYQEIGRAGRDGLRSECHLFHSTKDFMLSRFFLKDVKDSQHKLYQENEIRKIEAYVLTTECRRKQLLKSFDNNTVEMQRNDYNCDNCDNCKKKNGTFTRTEKYINNDKNGLLNKNNKTGHLIDYTYYGYIALGLVDKLNGKYGIGTLVDIIRGLGNKKIKDFMKELQHYGIAKEPSTLWWKAFYWLLISEDYLKEESVQDRFGTTIKMTHIGMKWYTTILKKYGNIAKNGKIDSIAECDKLILYPTKDMLDSDKTGNINKNNNMTSKIHMQNTTDLNVDASEASNAILTSEWDLVKDNEIIILLKSGLSISDIANKYNKTQGSIKLRLESIALRMYNEGTNRALILSTTCVPEDRFVKILEMRGLS